MHTTDRRYRLNGPMDDVAANILADQQEGPDPNPTLRCDECDGAHNWRHFKDHGQASADPDEPLLCSVCNAGILRRPKSVEEREAENHDIGRFLHADN